MRRTAIALLVLALSGSMLVVGTAAASAAATSGPDIVVLGGSAVVSDSVLAGLQTCTTGDVRRLAGSNRYATAATISAATFSPGVPVAAIATGEGFPDALSGGAAAGAAGGPILLVSKDVVPAATAAELSRLKPQRIVILGGPNAVSTGVESSLNAFTAGGVTRIAGANRYATASAVSAATFGPSTNTAYVATGTNFPDALAGGPAAIINGAPVLLVERDRIPNEIQKELSRLSVDTIKVLGGTASISASVESELRSFASVSVTRFAGANRYETAARVSEGRFAPGLSTIFVATGEGFPDALAGGPAAAANSAPMLLVQKNSVPTATANELARLTGGACGGGTPPPVPACSTVADILVQMNGPYGPDCPPITNLAGQAIKRLSSSDEYTFSDGTGLVRIDINTSSASNDVPLNTPIVITDGDVESREIRVSGWVLAP